MKIQRFVLSCLILVLIQTSVSGQLLYNNGVSITATEGVTIYVWGSVQNQSGQIDIDYTSSASEMIIHGNFVNNAIAGGNGYYRVMENWINNNIFNAGTGTVFLEGGTQQLSGSASTYFYNLTLSGTGAKTQTINQYCTGILNLNDIELKTQTFGFFVQNTNVTAISYGTGFVSSLNGGFLSRQTNVSSVYSFPVGSSVGIQRYRPVEITPTAATANTYTVRMANIDATTEGFDRSSLATEVCEINPLFYHQINRTSGTSPINLNIYYDNSADGNWEGIANWNTLPNLWDIIAGSNTAVGVPLYKASAINWSNFSQLPYALYSPSPTATITTTPSICEGDDILLQETGGDAISWNWQGPNSWNSTAQNPTISNATTLASGIYYVTVTNSYACTATDNINVIVNANPTIPIASTDCSGGNDNAILTVTSPLGANYEYSIGGAFQTSTTFGPLTNGNYTITVQDIATSCTSESGIITIDCEAECANPPSLNLSASSTNTCGTDIITVSGNTFGGSATQVSLSHNGNGTLDQATISTSPFDFTYTPDVADIGSNITITITTNNPDGLPCNPVSDTYIITVLPLPFVLAESNSPVGKGSVLNLSEIGGDAISWEWTGQNNFSSLDQNPSIMNFTTLEIGQYFVTGTDINGCIASDSIIVDIIPDLIIPDVLTPNDDGKNDTWRIQGITAYEKVEIVIFNRWGDEVFQFYGTGNAYSDTQNQFNGTRNNNKDLPFGTYVYLLKLDNDYIYKGTLTILR